MKLITGIFGLTLLTFSACQTKTKQSNPEQTDLVFKDSLGHTISKADLANTTGNVNYEITGNIKIDPRANALHQQARQLGQAGDYDLAISKLQMAMAMQPNWPYPTYDLAYIYLLKEDFENALRFYKRTDELAPKGFFTTKTALYTLEGEKLGRFPKGLYIEYMQIDWTDDPQEKFDIANTITEQVPDFAPAWKALANLLDDKTERLNAIEQGLSKNPDFETKGILLINKAIVLNSQGKTEEAKTILGNLIFSPDATTGNMELARFTLKSITEK